MPLVLGHVRMIETAIGSAAVYVASRWVQRVETELTHRAPARFVLIGLGVAAVGGREEASLVTREHAGAGDGIERITTAVGFLKRQAIVRIDAHIGAGARGVAFGTTILENHPVELLGTWCGRAAVGPDRQHSLAAAVGPAKATVHLHGPGAIADARASHRMGQRQGRHELAVVSFYPDRDLGTVDGDELETERGRRTRGFRLGPGTRWAEAAAAARECQQSAGHQYGSQRDDDGKCARDRPMGSAQAKGEHGVGDYLEPQAVPSLGAA